MRIRGLISLLLCLSLLYSSLKAESHWNLSLNSDQENDSLTERQKKSVIIENYEKDMLTGYFMAIVPGFFVHGAGNFYAGNNKRGTALLLTGIVGTLGLVYYGIASALSENSDGLSTKSKIWVGTSMVLFFESWFWDIATVGGEIKERHPPGAYLSIGPLPTINEYYNDQIFGIKLSFRF